MCFWPVVVFVRARGAFLVLFVFFVFLYVLWCVSDFQCVCVMHAGLLLSLSVRKVRFLLLTALCHAFSAFLFFFNVVCAASQYSASVRTFLVSPKRQCIIHGMLFAL